MWKLYIDIDSAINKQMVKYIIEIFLSYFILYFNF